MSLLVTWQATDPAAIVRETADPAEISAALDEVHCTFERREIAPAIAAAADADVAQDTVLDAYRGTVDEIVAAHEFVTVDVAGIRPSADPGWPEAARKVRATFIDEHTHGEDDEVRFMVRGSGVFFLHIEDKVHAVYAGAGDLLAVPRGTTHWFDTGPAPDFTAIRFFHNPQGWVGIPTGSDISQRFPDYDAVRARARTFGAA
jgi:1,2-dihydroxy-3-keto-5-methylthiopentene dioxygenase